MAMRHLRAAASGVVLACAGCIVAPPPAPSVPLATVAAPAAGPPRDCREFQQTITIGGKSEQGYGTTCRQPDGTWRIAPQNTGGPSRGYPAHPPYPPYPYYPW